MNPEHSRRRCSWLTGGTIVAIAAAQLVSGSTASAAGWQWHELDGDWCPDAASIDGNNNGYVESIWFDLDNDCRLDSELRNITGAENFHEYLSFDLDEDGRRELVLTDVNQQVGFDQAYLDSNEDGLWDIYTISPPSSTSSISIGGTAVSGYVAATSDVRTTLSSLAYIYPAVRCTQANWWDTSSCIS